MRYQLSINNGVVVFLSTNFQCELSSRLVIRPDGVKTFPSFSSCLM